VSESTSVASFSPSEDPEPPPTDFPQRSGLVAMPADPARRGAPQRSAFRLFAGLFRCCDLLTRVAGVLAILYVVLHLILGYLDPSPPMPTRAERCGDGMNRPSRILPQRWQGSEEHRLFDSALEAKQQWIVRASHSVFLGCSGQFRSVCFTCGSIDSDERCAFHDLENNWSWPEDLRGCLDEIRPTDAFYWYVTNTSAWGQALRSSSRAQSEMT
jgi:hypothetical protein